MVSRVPSGEGEGEGAEGDDVEIKEGNVPGES